MRPIPLWDVPRTLPPNWSETKKRWTDMMMHYRFIPTLENGHTSNSIYIDLMFTGNRPELERSADKLFDGFQDFPYGLLINGERTSGECLRFQAKGSA